MRDWRMTLSGVALLGALGVLTGCGQATVPPRAAAGTATLAPPDLTLTAVASVTSAPPAPTRTAHAVATRTVAEILGEIHSAGTTAAAANTRAALTVVPLEQTALARPIPTLYTFPPTPSYSSAPEPTPIIGLQPPEDCAPQIHGFLESNCWIVLLDNEYVYVDGGYRYDVRSGDLADHSLGAIVVFTRSLSLGGIGPTEIYPTAQRLGPMRIAAVDGARVTLLPDNVQLTPVSFVFDLRTRQWVSP